MPDDLPVAPTFTVHLEDASYEVPSLCPHRHGWLAHGMVNRQRRTITCPLHFSVFSLENGEQLSGPPCGSLACRRL
ncbi:MULTISPECIES: Rieske 2Fe-2S domain-containing protein [unclassified Pseudomonas]|uniref:Rieske (2Fe-2S) protein n=1 Tax=unclassified Pseudomonas TaxID=196821 RepID=UPI000BD20D1A|nr:MULTISPECIES: Rieske 2Fe-2S domain-containing protein [unclassified Pseudomonas]PVZ19782.1 Rieske-like 2Fe-2S protein [Pseudomonas sp. URIL14HWK12:I12]PVZ26848.1 Rieske-like 2Fe-2S protein [Pseudomonas sp. URIL14HWK12:I10]PVZ37737.1 Rieske-like 2Fe-2S protein [Pseudomonas sp. URIL14HWK12:I11]SNZ05869.1 Ferredoxin subunits of nitrite reductase and ring-hydroxylating dioxygenases [Pseudomonas sp. URIL14HWK12:I9]